MICINKNTEEYKSLLNNFGEDFTYYIHNNVEASAIQTQHVISGTGYTSVSDGVNINGLGLVRFTDGKLELNNKTYLKSKLNDSMVQEIKHFFNQEIFKYGENFTKTKYALNSLQTKPIYINNAVDFDKVKESVQDRQIEELQNVIEILPEDFEFNEVSLEQELDYRVPKRNADGTFTEFFSPMDEKEIVDSIFSDIIFNSEFAENKDISTEVENLTNRLDDAKIYFEQIVYDELEQEELDKIKNIDKAKEQATFVLNSWNEFESKVRDKFKAYGLKVSVADEIETDEDGANDSENNTVPSFLQENIELDPVDGLAGRIKLFLSFIPEVYYNKETGQVESKVNQFGLEKLYDFKKLYNELLHQFANQPNITYPEIIANLKAQREVKPIFSALASRLEARGEVEIQKQLVQGLRKVNLSSQILSVKKEEGVYNFKSFESNKNGIEKTIINGWKQNQLLGTDLFVQNDAGQLSISPIRVAFYQEWFDKLKVLQKDKNKELLVNEQKKLAKSLLRDLGINLKEEAWNELYSGLQLVKGIKKYKKSFDNQFSYTKTGAADGLFSALFADITGESNATSTENEDEDSYDVVKNNPLYTGNVHQEVLAKIQSRHETNIVTSLHINIEGKQIYDFINPSFEWNQINKLINDEGYRKELKNDLFAGAAPFFDSLFMRDESRLNYKPGILEGLKNLYGRQEKAKTRKAMSNREQLITSLSLFVNNGNQYGSFLELTKSDKTNSPLHSGVKKLAATKEDTTFIKRYFKQIIDAEIERIKFVQENSKEIKNKALKAGGKNFYFVHLLNEEYQNKIIYDEQGQLQYNQLKTNNKDFNENLIWNDGVFNNTITSDSYIVDIILDEFINSLYQQTKDQFKQLNVSEKIVNDNFVNRINELENSITSILAQINASNNEAFNNAKAEEIVKIRAEIDYYKGKDVVDDTIMQYSLNSWLFNASISMLFSGDPAVFYKGGKDINEILRKTYNEYGKRQAKDNAPGSSIEHEYAEYTSLIVKVDESPVEYLQNYDKLKAYNSVDTTDAIQYVTLKRYVQLMKDRGRLSQEVFDKLVDKIDNTVDNYYELDTEETSFIFGPEKPVEVFLQNQYTLSNGKKYQVPVYVKSAIFPLIPQLTRGFEMDAMRIMMEQNSIDQVYMTSAGKAGNTDKPLELFKGGKYNGSITQDQISSSKQQMKSEGFLFQQEIPFDEEKEKITFITQFNKLVLDTIGQINESIFAGKTGLEISIEKENIRKRMIDYEENKLRNQLGIQDGKVNNRKLRDLLIAKTSNLTLQEQQSLAIGEDGEFITPLFYNQYSNRFQSTLLSLVKKSVQPKMAGKSFVQASALGLRKVDKTGNIPTGIVATEKYDGSTLKMPRMVVAELYAVDGTEDYLTQAELDLVKVGKSFKRGEVEYTGKMLPAQVLVPFNFFGDEGKVNIEQYVNTETGKLDSTLLPSSLLRLLGARIPNQSHSSQLPIEIVGFLPTYVGDTIYVPDGITKQMGSDFDVDKLYVYKPNYSVLEDRIVSYQSEQEDIYSLQNEYFENLYTILNNPAMFEKVLAPLDIQDLAIIASVAIESNPYETYHSTLTQQKAYSSNSGAKSGVGTSSLHLTNNSLTQRTKNIDFAFQKVVNGQLVSLDTFEIIVGNVRLNTFSGLGKSSFRGEERTDSQNIISLQSALVDHAKEKLVDQINVNEDTFNAVFAFVRAKEKGEDMFNLRAKDLDPAIAMVNSQVVRDYIELQTLSQDEFAEKTNRKKNKENIIRTLSARYSFGEFNLDNIFTQGSFSIQDEEIGADAGKTLQLFLVFDAIGEELFTTIASTNADTKGAGSSIMESINKKDRLNDLKETYTYIKNRNELFDSPYSGETELSRTVDATLGFTSNYLEPLFGYQKLQDILYAVKQIKGGFLSLKEQKTIAEDYKKFVFSNSALGIWENPQEQRNRLLFGKESLAHRIIDLGVKYPNYFLFKKLQTRLGKTDTDASYITYNTNEKELDKSLIYSEFFDLSRSANPELREFLKDLLIYNYVVQGNSNGPSSFTQLIPPALLNHNKYLKDIEEDRYIKTEQFVRQLIQHRPFLAQSVDKKKYKQDLHIQVPFTDVNGKPQFVFVQDKKQQYVYELWNEQDEKLNYFLIGKLGSSYTNEYNYNESYVESTLSENFVPNLVNKGDFEKIIIQNPYKGDDASTGGFLVTDNVVSTLNNVLKQNTRIDSDLVQQAQLYKDILADEKIPVELKTSISSYYADNHTVSIAQKGTFNGTVENILHETAHALTVRTVDKVLTNPELFDDSVTEAVFNLVALKDYVVDKLIDNNKDKKEKAIYQYLKEELENIKELNKDARVAKLKALQLEYPNQIRLVYGTINVKEFITHVLTNRDFQIQIAPLRDTTGKISILDRLKEWFGDFIKALKDSLGIAVRSDSVLVSAANNAFKVIEEYPNLKELLDKLYSPSSYQKPSELNFNLDNSIYNIPSWYDNIVKQLNKLSFQESLNSGNDEQITRKRVRLNELREQIEQLKNARSVINRDADAYQHIADVAMIQAQWIRHLTNSPKLTIDDVTYANRLIKLWQDIDQVIVSTDDTGNPFPAVIKSIIGEYASLEKEFRPIAEQVASGLAKVKGIPTQRLFSSLKDVEAYHFYTMELNRNPNNAVQLLASLIDDTAIKKDTAEDRLADKLSWLTKYIADNNVDTSKLIQKNKFKYYSLINDEFNQEWTRWRDLKNKKNDENFNKKDYTDFVKNNVVLLDLPNLFEKTDANVISVATDAQIVEIAKQLYSSEIDSSKEVIKFVKIQLEEQRKKLQNYRLDLEAKLQGANLSVEEFEDINFSSESKTKINEWIKVNNPYLYKGNIERGNYSNRSYLALIPKGEHIQKDYIELMQNEANGTVLQELKAITKDLRKRLPNYKTEALDDSFIPIIHNKLINQTLNTKELVGTLKDKSTYANILKQAKEYFTANDYIPDNESLEDTIRFIDDEYKIVEKGEQSKNLIANLALFGKMAYHYSYFNEVKPSIELVKSLIETADTVERKYNGDPVPNGRNIKGSVALPNTVKQIETNISQVIYLNSTKPDIALPFTTGTPDFEEVYMLLVKERKGASEYQLAKLAEEQAILEKAEEEFNKSSKDSIVDRIKQKQFATTETLYDWYKEQIDEAQASYNRSEIGRDQLNALREKWYGRIKLLNRKTFYGSKVIDTAIKYKRLLTMGFSPFSGFTNLLGGTVNGYIYAAGGVDFDTSSYNKAIGIMLSSWKGIQGNSDVQATKLLNIARVLQIDKDLIDKQGIKEDESSFNKAAYYLMRKSENFGRMSLVTAYLLHNKVGEKSLWDSFDVNGKWIGETEEWANPESRERIALIAKMTKITGQVMGSTGVKMLNQYSLGRAVGQFRVSWLPEAFAARFETESFDARLGRDVKGRYITYKDLGLINSAVGVLKVWQSIITKKDTYSELKLGNGKSMSEADVENLRKNSAEALFIVSIMALVASLKYIADDDEENKAIYYALINQFLFLERDLTSVHVGTLDDLLGKSIVPSYSLVKDYSKFITKATDYIFTDEVEQEVMFKALGKIVPGINLYNKFLWQTESLLEN